MLRRGAVVVALVIGSSWPAAQAGAHEGSCIGVGPVLDSCSTGSHVRGGEFIQHGVDLEASRTFTGRISSFFVSPSGNVKRSCDLIAGELQGCFTDEYSVWPKVGESFDHLCFADFLNTDSGSGIGAWGCFVRHD
jgi:hypothetical protein